MDERTPTFATCLNSTKEKGVETLAAHRSDQEAESVWHNNGDSKQIESGFEAIREARLSKW